MEREVKKTYFKILPYSAWLLPFSKLSNPVTLIYTGDGQEFIKFFW